MPKSSKAQVKCIYELWVQNSDIAAKSQKQAFLDIELVTKCYFSFRQPSTERENQLLLYFNRIKFSNDQDLWFGAINPHQID